MARDFLDWVSVRSGSRWLDIGCGTGALTGSVLAHAAPGELVGVDRSDRYVAYAREQVQGRRARFAVCDAQQLPFDRNTFDAVVSGLVLNFIPDPLRAVGEMARVARRGGTLGTYVWDYAGGMELMRHFWDAAVALDSAALELDEGRRFPLCQPGPLADLWHAAGLLDVEFRAIDVPTIFVDFDDYWSPFLGGQGPAPGYAMSLEEQRRTALRERIRSTLPIQPDGSIHLIARAWAVRGTVPEWLRPFPVD